MLTRTPVARLFANSNLSILICNDKHRVIRGNRAYCESSNVTESEVKGMQVCTLYKLPSNSDLKCFSDLALSQDGIWHGEVCGPVVSRDQSRQQLTIIALQIENQRNYIYIFSELNECQGDSAPTYPTTYLDKLTQLPSLHSLEQQIEKSIQQVQGSQNRVAVVHVDIDRFKNVNDSLGHRAGDKLLSAVGARLARAVSSANFLGRLGCDEFMVVISATDSRQQISDVVEQVLQCFKEPYYFENQDIFLLASVGVSIYPDDAGSTDQLLRHAARAMSEAKKEGNCCRHYSCKIRTNKTTPLALETSLHHAMANNEFVLHYQPQFNIATQQVVGAEALIRWQHPERGLILPAEFISVLESTGMIVSIGEWVISEAQKQYLAWQRQKLPPFRIAVNLSAKQFRDPNLSNMIRKMALPGNQSATWLELEVTESVLMEKSGFLHQSLKSIHEMGIKLAIDDFGTGYSSLSYVKNFPLDIIKIDKSFIRDAPGDKGNIAIIQAIIALSKSLGLEVIAEGIENTEQFRLIERLGCNVAQGFLMGRPLSPEEFSYQMQGWLQPPLRSNDNRLYQA